MSTRPRRIRRILASPWFLAGVLVLAATFRVWHVLALRQLPLFDRLIVDSEAYDLWAQRIAAGDWLSGARPFYQDPLYPYVLAALYKLFGRDLLLVRLVQVACGVATCGLVAALGRQLAGPAAGNLGALLMALNRAAVFQEGEFEKTALSVFLATLSLVCFLRRGTWWMLGAGVALGLAALTRANLLLMVPAALVYFGWRKEWRPAVALVLGTLVVIMPVTLRNGLVAHEWVLTASGMGQNFYTGNNPANHDGRFRAVPFVRPETAHEEGDFLAEAERRVGHPLTAKEASSYWFRESLHTMEAEPAFAARAMASKAALFWSDVEVADAWDLPFIERFSPPLRPLLPFSLFLGLAVLGLIPALRTEGGRVMAAWIVIYSASVIAFFIFSRYRLHVVPLLAAFAGAGIVWSAERLRQGEGRRLLVPGLAAVALAATSALAFPSYRIEDTTSAASLAELYQERGDFVSARRVVDDALRREPGDARLLCEDGKLRLRLRDAAGAVTSIGRCVQANPYTPDGWYLLGLAQEANGDSTGAQQSYRTQLRYVPGHEGARARLR
ncbi:MAG TPA: glycosyltransferase family 39 protein [Candidatus Polarisedimenticolaceae bacterium]|nr:glycosyltransferase family 39 protein [Candidatus Polarisedimenticolaceae bacterium]